MRRKQHRKEKRRKKELQAILAVARLNARGKRRLFAAPYCAWVRQDHYSRH